MTYIISTITSEGILMASDSRLNYHNEEVDNSTGERFQVIVATADCIRKTFVIDPLNIGIQFIGIGYFPENGVKYPISHFLPSLAAGIVEDDSIIIKFQKIYGNLKQLTQVGNTGQYVNGVMAGYENGIPFIATFNTFIDDFKVNSYEVGAYVESESCNDERQKARDKAIDYINEKIFKVSERRPQDVGGPIEILEIKSNASNSWLQENPKIFNGNLDQLIDKWRTDPDTIGGVFLNPPVRQKLSV